MMRNLRKILRDENGAAMIEFALLAPLIMGAFLGVMQIGIGMQAYNALRNVSADTSRYALVEYQNENKITTGTIESHAETIAAQSPYGLTWGTFDATVTQPSVQRVSGATEYQIVTSYQIPSVLGFLGLNSIPISYSRPIFVLT